MTGCTDCFKSGLAVVGLGAGIGKVRLLACSFREYIGKGSNRRGITDLDTDL